MFANVNCVLPGAHVGEIPAGGTVAAGRGAECTRAEAVTTPTGTIRVVIPATTYPRPNLFRVLARNVKGPLEQSRGWVTAEERAGCEDGSSLSAQAVVLTRRRGDEPTAAG